MDNKSLFHDLIRTISLVLDFDESEKYNHSWRVAWAGYHISKGLGLGDANSVYYAGLLHDVGAIGLSNHIVHHAKSNFRDHEARGHSHRGSQIIRHYSPLAHIEPFIRDHHEHYDGTGFPSGLKGNSIAIESSIILLADLLDLALADSSAEELVPRAVKLARGVAGKQISSELGEAFIPFIREEQQFLSELFLGQRGDLINRDTLPIIAGIEAMSPVDLLTQSLWFTASLIDTKHSYTMGHSIRVALLAHRIARILGEKTLNHWDVIWAGLLHDIGKVGTPRKILDKAGPLDAEEWRIMKRHPRDSYEIIASINDLAYLAKAAATHHERYDGHGYPDGLAGENIPLIGRILAYADAYDALTSDRAYRKRLSKETATEIITSGIGRAYDPHLADIAFYVFEHFGPEILHSPVTMDDFQHFLSSITIEDTTSETVTVQAGQVAAFSGGKLVLQDAAQWSILELDEDLRFIRGKDTFAIQTGEPAADSLPALLNERSRTHFSRLLLSIATDKPSGLYVFTQSGKPIEIIVRRHISSWEIWFRNAEHLLSPIKRMSLFFRNFLTTTDGVLFTDPQLSIIDVNRTFCDMLLYRAEDVIGQQPTMLFNRDIAELVNQRAFNALRSSLRQYWQTETSLLRKDGSEFPVSLTLTALRDAHHDVIGFVGTIVDISERRKAEQRISAINTCLLQLNLDHSRNVAGILSTTGSILGGDGACYCRFSGEDIVPLATWNMPAGWEYLLDRDRPLHDLITSGMNDATTDSRNKPLSPELITVSSHHCTAEQTQRQFAGSEFTHCVGHRISMNERIVGFLAVFFKDGHVLVQEELDFLGTMASVLATEEEREFARTALIDRDRMLEEKARQLEKISQLKSDLVAIASHDLKSPLNGMIGYASLVEESAPTLDSDTIKTIMKKISSSGYQMINLINRLLNLDKLESGRLVLAVQPLDIGEILQSSLDMHQLIAGQKRVSIQLKREGFRRDIPVDRIQIEQIINNILSNAIRYSPAGSTITLDVFDGGGRELHVSVCDEGPGLRAGDEELIFAKYYQNGSGDAKAKALSSGLGLYIAHSLVTLHGGTITANNRLEGGCCFHIVLPVPEVVDSRHCALVFLQRDMNDAEIVSALKRHIPSIAVTADEDRASDILSTRQPPLIVLTEPDPEGQFVRMLAKLGETRSYRPHLVTIDGQNGLGAAGFSVLESLQSPVLEVEMINAVNAFLRTA